MGVHVVVTNWKRAWNVAEVVKAFRRQTVPPARITVVDNSGRYWNEQFCADQVWRFPDNGVGPTCRFAPALFDFHSKYTLFHDDDLAPGVAYIETLLREAEFLRDRFATIGGKGRRNLPGRYVARNVPQVPNRPVAVDMTVRSHLIQTVNLPLVFRMIAAMLQGRGCDIPRPTKEQNWTGEDDILLCCGIQRFTGYASYLTRAASPDGWMNRHELNSDNAYSAKPNHEELRSQLLGYMERAGWRSLWREWEPRVEAWARRDFGQGAA